MSDSGSSKEGQSLESLMARLQKDKILKVGPDTKDRIAFIGTAFVIGGLLFGLIWTVTQLRTRLQEQDLAIRQAMQRQIILMEVIKEQDSDPSRKKKLESAIKGFERQENMKVPE